MDTVFCIASGPSLTREDCEAVRLSGIYTIVINNTWELCRWADVLFAGDAHWWRLHGSKVDIPAHRVSLTDNAERQFGAKKFKRKSKRRPGYNSGCIAIEYAISQGAKKVFLLGYDCSVKNGIHWHGEHKKSGNPDSARCQSWRRQFKQLRDDHPDVEVVNCSRYTELDMFPRVDLDKALSQAKG